MTYETFDGSLYHYTAGTYCGVLMKERVMKKLAALQAKHMEDVKRVLADGAEAGEVFPYMWTLHHPEGNQTTVYFVDTSADVANNIKHAVASHAPQHMPLVFIAPSMDEAKRMADERHESLREHA